jgi:hypothetical protein
MGPIPPNTDIGNIYESYAETGVRLGMSPVNYDPDYVAEFDPNPLYPSSFTRFESAQYQRSPQQSFEELQASYEADEAGYAAVEAAEKRAQMESLVLQKGETPTESYRRVSIQKHSKSVKSVKTAAKKCVKQKKMTKIGVYFGKLDKR